MSIADEFKLKKIPRAYYAPNKRTLVNTNTGEVQVQKKAVKIGLKPLRLVSKERERSKKEKVKKIGVRKEKADFFTKTRENMLTWTLRELLEYLETSNPTRSATVSNIMTDIIKGMYNDQR